MTPLQLVNDKGGRRRKAHTKSRRGCKNCKIRGVKCDETKPSCERCKAYGVACNYTGDTKTSCLEIVFNGAVTIRAHPQSLSQVNQAISKPNVQPFMYPAICSSDSNYSFKLNREEIDRLGRFQSRTILAIGSAKSAKFFQSIMVEMACASPCLMHIIQTITGIHDRYLSNDPSPSNARLTISERYHLGQAAKLFHEELSKPIEPNRRDALWATAALLGAIAWATIEASSPEEAWPLASPEPNDLEWIKMSDNKAAIWEIAQPMREDSIFHPLAGDYQNGYNRYSKPQPGIEGIPTDFVKLFELSENSTPENNVYHAAVRSLTSLLPLQCEREKMGPFISWIARFRPEFKALLESKDARALLLLAYWYMKVANAVWSLDRRSKLECQAICIYLERYHWLERDLMRLLQPPKKWCGAQSQYGSTPWGLFTGQNTGGAWMSRC